MPRRRHDGHLVELAKRGAEVQLRELVQEAKYLIALFPHLRDSYDKDELPLSFIMAKGAGWAVTITTRSASRSVNASPDTIRPNRNGLATGFTRAGITRVSITPLRGLA